MALQVAIDAAGNMSMADYTKYRTTDDTERATDKQMQEHWHENQEFTTRLAYVGATDTQEDMEEDWDDG